MAHITGSAARGAATRRTRGFTLIELVITITVGSVVVAFMSLFIVTPMLSYSAQTRRAQLVDEADSTLRFMGRDIKYALPNSVRTASSGTVTAIEFIATLDGARYQDNGPVANPALALDFTAADSAFATTVPFTRLTLPWSSSSAYLVIYNVGVPGANAYQAANVITPAGTTINVSAGSTANQDLVTLSPAFRFAYGSPEKRVYLASGPVSYLCDTGAGTLTRYSGYSLMTTQATTAAALTSAGATASQVAGDVAACTFTYVSGTPTRNALAELTLQLTNSGENVQLLYEVQLVNAP
jgi:MSHA biogenesis protein MshO